MVVRPLQVSDIVKTFSKISRPRPRPWLDELEWTLVARPWPPDHNSVIRAEPGVTGVRRARVAATRTRPTSTTRQPRPPPPARVAAREPDLPVLPGSRGRRHWHGAAGGGQGAAVKIRADSQHMHRTELNCERLTDDDPVHCHLHAVLSARDDIVVPRTDTKTFCRLRTSPREQASDLYDLSATLNCR